MKKTRVLIIAAAFLLAAALSVTALAASAFDCADSATLKTALDGSVSGDAINLTANIALTASGTLKKGVSLNSSGSPDKTLTVGSTAALTIDLSAATDGKLAILATAGNIGFQTTDGGGTSTPVTSFIDGAPQVNGTAAHAYKTSGQNAGYYYFDTASSTVNVTATGNSSFVEGYTGTANGNLGIAIALVNESGITRDGSGKVTAVDTSKVYYGTFAKSGSSPAITFSNIPVSGTTTYRVMVRVGTSTSSLVETDNSLVLFNSASAGTAAKSLTWTSLVAGRAYDAFTVTNPAAYPVDAHIAGSGITASDYLTLTAAGKLTTLRPMARTGITCSFDFTLPDGYTKTVTDTTRQTEIASPVTAPSSTGVYVNQRTKLFTIDMPASGSASYAGYELTDASCTSGDLVFSMGNGAEYVTATNTMSGVNVDFTFTFKDATERAAAGTGKSFSVTKTVRMSASVYNPTHPVTVTAPKIYIAAGESVQLSVPYERLSNATSGNLAVAFATGDGKVVGIAPGTATIYVTTIENGQGTIQIVVTSANASVYASKTTLAEEETAQIYLGSGAGISYAYSNNSRVLTVSASGRVTAVSPGTATVYVSANNGTGGYITFTVVQKSLTVRGSSSIKVGATGQLTVSYGESIANVTSSDSSVVSVLGNGAYYGLKNGTAVLTVTAVSGRVGTFTVTVTGGAASPVARTIKVGQSTQLTVTGDSIVAAYSENESVATVTSKGKVTGVSAGTAVIHIYTRTGSAGTATITVTGSSVITNKTLYVDQSTTLKISGKKIVAATLDEDNGTVSVTNSGKVTALCAGTDTVLLITSDNSVYRVTVTVKARSGEVDISKNSKLSLRSKAGGGSTLVYLRDGYDVTILARSGSYFKVTAVVKGKTYTGYVLRKYIDKY